LNCTFHMIKGSPVLAQGLKKGLMYVVFHYISTRGCFYDLNP
jgi:hypothetical protein